MEVTVNRMLVAVLVLTGAAGPLVAQALSPDRVLKAGDGEVRFSYAVRPDVCGDGERMIRYRDHESWVNYSGDWRDGGRRWSRACIDGPARVSLVIRDGAVAKVRTVVGGAWPSPTPAGVTDFGQVDARSASAGLLALARRTDSGSADDLVFPAILADSTTVWPDLLRLARDGTAGNRARKAAIFWLSQEAGDAVTRELGELASDVALDRDLREHAVFALSQLPRDEGVPVLVRVARQNPDPSVRRKALFWLGQSDDPRALALFEEILSRPK
jgi:hypothetical protein